MGCPTLVGVEEAENEALLLALAEKLTPSCGFTYTITHRESADARGIDVALLSDPRRTVVQDTILQQTCTILDTGITDATLTCPSGQQPLFSRPPLQVTVEVDGRPHTLLLNHFKSKRGGEAETAAERLAQAQHINSLVDGLLAADSQARIIVLGDFNDYELSPTLQEMTGNGRLTNTLSQIPLPQRYSFIFSGAAQLIDGILVSPTLADEVAFATIQHVNADFPDALAADPTSPYQATDHDLPLIVLNGKQLTATALPTLTPIPAPSPTSTPSFNWLWLLVLGGLVLIGGTAVYLARRR